MKEKMWAQEFIGKLYILAKEIQKAAETAGNMHLMYEHPEYSYDNKLKDIRMVMGHLSDAERKIDNMLGRARSCIKEKGNAQ